MQVDIARDPKFSKADHLFVLLAEGRLDVDLPADAQKVIREAGFQGRSDEAITVLNGAPKKVTLIGLGKAKALSLRGVRAGIVNVGKTARKQRDRNIAVIFPYTLPGTDEEKTTLLIADALAQSDYKYDPYITVKKDQKSFPIDATLVAPSSLDN